MGVLKKVFSLKTFWYEGSEPLQHGLHLAQGVSDQKMSSFLHKVDCTKIKFYELFIFIAEALLQTH